MRELDLFLGYSKVCGNLVAEFALNGFDKPAVLNKESCERRLENLKAGGYPHDQTEAALRGWPEEEGSR